MVGHENHSNIRDHCPRSCQSSSERCKIVRRVEKNVDISQHAASTTPRTRPCRDNPGLHQACRPLACADTPKSGQNRTRRGEKVTWTAQIFGPAPHSYQSASTGVRWRPPVRPGGVARRLDQFDPLPPPQMEKVGHDMPGKHLPPHEPSHPAEVVGTVNAWGINCGCSHEARANGRPLVCRVAPGTPKRAQRGKKRRVGGSFAGILPMRNLARHRPREDVGEAATCLRLPAPQGSGARKEGGRASKKVNSDIFQPLDVGIGRRRRPCRIRRAISDDLTASHSRFRAVPQISPPSCPPGRADLTRFRYMFFQDYPSHH